MSMRMLSERTDDGNNDDCDDQRYFFTLCKIILHIAGWKSGPYVRFPQNLKNSQYSCKPLNTFKGYLKVVKGMDVVKIHGTFSKLARIFENLLKHLQHVLGRIK